MTAQQAFRPERPTARPALREVPRPARRLATVPFVMVVAVMLAVGMVGVLVLTITLQAQAFTVQDEQRQANVLDAQLTSLQAQVAQARSIQHLAVAAQNLGMRPNPEAAQLRLSDGQVIGEAKVVTGAEIPTVRYRTPEQVAAQIAALDQAEADRIAKAKADKQARQQARLEAEAKKREAALAKQQTEAAKKATAAATATPKGQQP